MPEDARQASFTQVWQLKHTAWVSPKSQQGRDESYEIALVTRIKRDVKKYTEVIDVSLRVHPGREGMLREVPVS
jgi:hypothetical protein